MRKKLETKFLRFLRIKAGYSLTETMAVVFTIGALATVAMPRYLTAIENARADEGEQTLLALLASQRRYELRYNNYAADLNDLDIQIMDNSNSFNLPVVNNNAANVAEVTKIGGDYTLQVSAAGVISCNDGGGTICAKLGY